MIKFPFIIAPSSLFIPIKKTWGIKVKLWNFFFNNSFYSFENFRGHFLSSWRNTEIFSFDTSEFFAIIGNFIVFVVSIEHFDGTSFWTSSHRCHACPCRWSSFIALVHSAINSGIFKHQAVVCSEIKINISLRVKCKFFGYAISRNSVWIQTVSHNFIPFPNICLRIEILHILNLWAFSKSNFPLRYW